MKFAAKGRKVVPRTRRSSVPSLIRWAMQRHRQCKATSLAGWRAERMYARLGRTQCRRGAIGLIKATVGPHYFAGAYTGAEYD